jgi:hypothetical protein
VFVPGPLFNPMNGSHGHWSKRARWAKGWRERTGMLLLSYLGQHYYFTAPPRATEPKVVTFHAQTGARWDDDNLRAGMKPIRDACKDAGLIHDDGPDSGHVFEYTQAINRQQRGVRITIRALDDVARALGARREGGKDG